MSDHNHNKVFDINKRAIEYQKSIAIAIKNFCKPLNEYFGIALFSYFKVFKDSSYILLTNDIELTKEYCFTIESDIIYFQNYLEKRNNREIILWPEKPENQGMLLNYNHNFWHGMSITEKKSDSIDVFVLYLIKVTLK